MSSQITAHVRSAAHELLAHLEAAEDDEAAVARAIDACLARLRALGIEGPENRLPSSELWNVAGHLLKRGWLQHRACAKPRGYAGDHELLERIYQRRLCDDPVGKPFDAYFQAQAAPQAVRNRMAMMADWIVTRAKSAPGRPLKVGIVGSAVGLEIAAALQSVAAADLRVTLLDLDPAAIERAQVLLAGQLSLQQLVAETANLFRLPERKRLAASLQGADLIFCPGLFDYLDDEAAPRMLQALYEPLAPGGRLTIFQFAPHNPTRAYMEWFGNWYLIYRTRGQLQRVVEAAALDAAAIEYGSEPLGIDLFVSLTKPTTVPGERPA